MANSQVGVFLGYASRKSSTLLDGQLFVPDLWFTDDHAAQRTATGMPATLPAQSKPEIALALLQQAVARRCLPARWVAADALYGNGPAFRDGIAALELWSMTAVSSGTLIWRRQPATAASV